jgi:hypothetical protein
MLSALYACKFGVQADARMGEVLKTSISAFAHQPEKKSACCLSRSSRNELAWFSKLPKHQGSRPTLGVHSFFIFLAAVQCYP